MTVTDGQTGNPVTGATVNGATTDANRKISVIFTQVGTQEVIDETGCAFESDHCPPSFLDFGRKKKQKFVESFYLTTKEKLLISNFR